MRFLLIRVRENAESIAFYGAERQELSAVVGALMKIIHIAIRRIRVMGLYDFFVNFYNYMSIIGGCLWLCGAAFLRRISVRHGLIMVMAMMMMIDDTTAAAAMMISTTTIDSAARCLTPVALLACPSCPILLCLTAAVPSCVLAPSYFAGKVEFGVLSQVLAPLPKGTPCF